MTADGGLDGDVRFHTLGLVSISNSAEHVVLQPSKPVSLLAAMLVRPNQTLSLDYLQAAVWDDPPPTSAKATLHTYILRLRKLFRRYGVSDEAVQTVPSGYRFPATAASLDLVEFGELVAAARAQPDLRTELTTLRAALALWQGPILTNVASTTLHRREVPRLHEQWLAACERRFDIELYLGHHRQAAIDMRAATQADPGHERFWEQLVEALYRSGRQSDALAEYRRIKTYLHDEFGVDPGPGLQKLELAILRSEELPVAAVVRRDPAITVTPPSGRRSPVTATSVTRSPVTAVRPAPPIPGLPPALANFVGRRGEVERIAQQLSAPRRGPAVVVISGPPGVGKTALAVHIAHLVAAQFPGGQCFVPLSDDAARPARAQAAAAGPQSLTVLDGARSMDEVGPLLPSDAGSAAVITSRASLAALATARGAAMVRLGPLTDEDSALLMASMVGHERAAREAESLRELAEECGHFPLALTLASAQLSLSRRRSVADYLNWLRPDIAGKLSFASAGSVAVADLMRSFVDDLRPGPGDVYIWIAASPGPPTISSVATYLGLSLDEAERLLDQLVDVSLLEVGPTGEYYHYPLLRAAARSIGPAVLRTAEALAAATPGRIDRDNVA